MVLLLSPQGRQSSRNCISGRKAAASSNWGSPRASSQLGNSGLEANSTVKGPAGGLLRDEPPQVHGRENRPDPRRTDAVLQELFSRGLEFDDEAVDSLQQGRIRRVAPQGHGQNRRALSHPVEVEPVICGPEDVIEVEDRLQNPGGAPEQQVQFRVHAIVAATGVRRGPSVDGSSPKRRSSESAGATWPARKQLPPSRAQTSWSSRLYASACDDPLLAIAAGDPFQGTNHQSVKPVHARTDPDLRERLAALDSVDGLGREHLQAGPAQLIEELIVSIELVVNGVVPGPLRPVGARHPHSRRP